MRVPLLLTLALCVSFALPTFAEGDPYRLGNKIIPEYQEIFLQADAREANYTGYVNIRLNVVEATDEVRFHAENMELTSIVLKGPEGGVVVTPSYEKTGLVIGKTDRTLEPGYYNLRIDFEDDFDTQAHSWYRLDVDGEGYTYTQFESDDAREAFPCWDEPEFKFPYQLTMEVPKQHMAISNTPIVKQTVGPEWKRVVFERTPPMPSYLLAIATGPLETVDIPGMSIPGRVVTPKNQSHLTEDAVRMTPPLLKALEEYFGSKYPYKKLDLIAVPEFWPGAMENPGAVTFAERILLLDPDTATLGNRRRLAAVNAHELAHMWFGNLVTMKWWDDLWLNEAFASWMGDKITHQVFPEFGMDVSQLGGINSALTADAQLATRAMRQPVVSTDNLIMSADVIAYQKGQGVLSMVEQWVTADQFRKGMKLYMDRHQWGNASGSDLWKALSDASGKDVTAVLQSFLEQEGFPLIRLDVLNDKQVKVSQKRFLHHGVEDPKNALWRVPIGLRYADDRGTHEKSILLDTPSVVLDLEPNGALKWVHLNSDQMGFYRFALSGELLNSLADHAPDVLSTRERVGLIGNISALLDGGLIPGDTYLELLSKFSNDPAPQVTNSLIGALSKVEGAFVPDDARPSFAFYVRHTLGPALERYGMMPQQGEDETISLFRPNLVGWMGKKGMDPDVLREARALADLFIEDPKSIPPSLASVALSLSAMDGDMELFELYRTRFENAKNPTDRQRFLSSLGQFGDPKIMETALDYTLTGPLRPNELVSIPFGMTGEGDAASRKVWEWMTANYEAIGGRIPPPYLVYMPYFAGGCSDDNMSRAEKFFSDPKHSPAGTEKNLAKVVEGISSCVELREREGEAVKDYLDKLTRAR